MGTKKNCKNCIHLEWVNGDIGDPCGYVCNGRVYKSDKMEDIHLKQLDSKIYLEKSKKCCELKRNKGLM